MSFYDFDINKASIELLPPDKRYEKNITLIQSLLSPLQWLRDLIFGSYYEGLTVSAYAPGTYNYLDQVIYEKKIYSSLIDNNTDDPTTVNWEIVQDNFIGIKERIRYNGNKLILEYALNKEFNTVFRQPENISDIYILNLSALNRAFIIGETEPYSSPIGESDSSLYIIFNFALVYLNNFQINIPSAAYALTNEQAIRIFVNQYIPAGINYTIQTY